MTVGLGKPIRVCTDHIHVMRCGCLGVELGEPEELQAATHPGCAVCRIQPTTRPRFRIVRKCSQHGCYGRFRRVPYDDTYLDEWAAVAKSKIARIAHALRRITPF